jgi:hypothetical protein
MAPRISDIPFFQNLIKQRARPDPVRSSILVTSQVLASFGCSSALLESNLRYEAVVVLVSGVASTLYHSCDERLACPSAYTLGNDVLWQVVDNLAFFSQLSTFVAAACGVSTRLQVLMRSLFFVMQLALLLFTQPFSAEGQLAHLAMWVAPFVALYFAHQKRLPKTGQPEALAAGAGLVFPAALLHLASIFTGVEDLDDGNPKFHNVARGPLPRTPHFWMFHSLWHMLLACAMFLACLYRMQRPKASARPR